MPELPEVESVRRQLEPALVGRRFERVRIDDPRLVRPYEPAEVAAELEGERVAAVERRGKYLVVRFESGRVLLIHLRMTGSLLHAPNGSLPDDPHRRAVVKLDDGSDVAYRDVRRFGTWLLLEPGEAEPYLAARESATSRSTRSSRQPGSASVSRVAARRSRRRSSTSERSRGWGTSTSTRRCGARDSIRCAPRPASTAHELRRLHRGIRAALEHGLARQGSTLRDYRLPDGSGGSMQDEFRVYGRRDEPCDRCGTPIARTQVAGRTTWFCPTCQPADPLRRRGGSSRRPSRSRRQSSV